VTIFLGSGPHTLWEFLMRLPGPPGLWPVVGLLVGAGYIKLASFGWRKRAEQRLEAALHELERAEERKRMQREYLARVGLPADTAVVDLGDRPSSVVGPDPGAC
jgi:hypothetical protein